MCAILQAALEALRSVPSSWIEERLTELKSKRDLAYSLLMDIPNVKCPKPDGAFYLLPDVSAYYNKISPSNNSIRNSDDLCFELLKAEQVALVSGDAFGAPNCIRISYAASEEIITTSLTRLKKFLVQSLR